MFRKLVMHHAGRCAFVLLVAGAVAPSHAADRDVQLDVGSAPRTFSLHIPDGQPPAGGFPVILAFHGGGGRGAGMRRITGFDALADTRRFIAVYPDGIDKHWNDGRSTIKNPQPDVAFTGAVLDWLAKTYPIDAGRVFATGVSNGALFTERLGCDLSPRIAAIAPVAGTLPSDIAPGCRPAQHVAVLQIDGTADPIMPYDGGSVAQLGGYGEGGKVLSVSDTAATWARLNGCTAKAPDETLPPAAPLDPTRIARTRYTGCPASGTVTVLTVREGGHTWPGSSRFAPVLIVGRTSRQIDASAEIVGFFLGLPRR